ncbi:MAG TPA: LacI family DNA-binding transcriptional regulator [Bacilli bacterium]
MTVTIKDIAERAGVSFSTVSKALRNSPLVKESTKQKIVAIAGQMGYIPNIAARKLVSNKSGSFGVIWPSLERMTPSVLITKVNDLLEDRGFTMMLSINRFETALAAFHRFKVDAILLFYDRDQSLFNKHTFAAQIPVLYYGIAGTTPYPTIDCERKTAINLAIQHLVQLGHQSIAYIGNPPYTDLLQMEKVNAFTTQMRNASLTGKVIPVARLDSIDGYHAAKALFLSEERPTAMISGSYDLTRGILRAAHELGIRIPEQLSLISYDNIPQMDALDIPVSAVGVEINTIAEQIARSLADLAEGKPHPETISLKPEIVIRASTARA